MVKIFVGNLPQDATEDEIRALFEEYGKVNDCDIVKNFAFVHMKERKAATKAIKSLQHHKLRGTALSVQASHSRNQGPVKLHVASVEKGCEEELHALFEEYGTVTECAIVKNFAFIHMANHDEAMDAMRDLDNSQFQGKRINVQLSRSRPKYEEQEDYSYPPAPPPAAAGHWPPHYPGEHPKPPPPSYMRGRYAAPAYPAPPQPPAPPRRSAYPERPYDADRDSYNVVDYYEKYRAGSYGMPPYDPHRPGVPPPPPPPPSSASRVVSAPHNPYERRPPPPPPPQPPSSYYSRDRSPLKRAPAPATAGNGYSHAYDRSRAPPLSRTPAYGAPPVRSPYPPPQAPRYSY